jgi:hypothetical protein
MSDLYRALNSVHRWHTNPHLARMLQTNAQHSGSMAALALELWPDCSRDLLKACILHDAPEAVTGDMPWGAKRDPAIKAAMHHAEDQAAMVNGWTFWTDEVDTARLKFLDLLEAWRFAAVHAPHILAGDGWPEVIAWLFAEAERMGVEI